MTDSDEKLSSLLDGYLDDDNRATLDEVAGDVNLQYRLRRYRMIGEAMRGELPPAIDTGFHSAVMARIRARDDAASPNPATPRNATATDARSPALGWARLKPAAGLAVAATVAMVTVAVWKPLERETDRGDALVSADQQKIQQLAGQQPQGDVVPASGSLQPLGTRWKFDRDMPGMQHKLNAYLVNHTEYSNSVQGLIPQARVAGFDAQQ